MTTFLDNPHKRHTQLNHKETTKRQNASVFDVALFDSGVMQSLFDVP